MSKVTFNIEVTMEERWVDCFCSMLNYMQTCGNIGHSSLVGFYADGDGDFRLEFSIDRQYECLKGMPKYEIIRRIDNGCDKSIYIPERIYDAH